MVWYILNVVLLLHLFLSQPETEEAGEETLQPGPYPQLRGGAGVDREDQEEEEEEASQQISSHRGSLFTWSPAVL